MARRWNARRTFDPALPELRRRTSWLLRAAPANTRAFVRLVPLLLHARFKRPSFDHDPPGLRLAPRRRYWGKLCAQLELPPPFAFASGRPIIHSAVLSPRVDGRLDLLILPVDDVSPHDVRRLVTHIELLAGLAARFAPGVEVKLASRAELAPAIVPWAAVCAGDVPVFADGLADRCEVVLRAPSALARCLALLIEPGVPSPLETLRTNPGPARPEAFLARWSKHPLVTELAQVDLGSLPALKDAGVRLRSACAHALRRLPPRDRRPLRAALRAELFSSLLPAAFRPALEALVRGRCATEKRTAGGWVLCVDGVELARGATLDEVRAAAVAESPLLARTDSPWPRVGKLHASGQKKHLVVVETGVVKHLVVSVSGAGRPRARRVDGVGLLRFVLAARVRGIACEIVTSMGSDQALVMRLAQIAGLSTVGPVGIEVGDRLLYADEHHLRSLPLKLALARPRRLTWVPVEHELGRSLRPPGHSLLPTTHAVAWPLGEARASVIFVDQSGLLVREEVARPALEAHLVESRELLRQAPVPELMSVTVHPLLAALAGRRLDAEMQIVPLDVDCEWPYTIRVWLDGEAFCGPGDLSWSALAESILSRWSPGTWGRVGVRRVSFIRPPASSSALYVLAVRARVLRRVASGLHRITRILEAA